MKRAFTAAVLTAIIGLADILPATAATYTTCNWLNNAASAVTFTFDDGLELQFTKAVPLLDQYNFKGTFFIVTDWATSRGLWPELKTLAENGHEIASHTVTHPTVAGRKELEDSKRLIEEKTGIPCLTVAYPYCNFPSDTEALEACYIAGRVCDGNGDFNAHNTRDMYNLRAFITGTTSAKLKTDDDFKNKLSSVFSKKEWCIFLIHDIEGGSDYSPTKTSALRSALSYLDTYVKRDRFWVGTFKEVSQYIKENTSTRITEISADDDSLVVTLTNSLDSSLYDCPLTVRRALPDGWAQISATQDGREIKSWVSGTELFFNAVPNAGNVIVRVTQTTRIRQIDGDAEGESATVSFHGDEIMVNSVSPVSSLQLTDMSGREVYSSTGEAGLNANRVRRGNYVLNITLQDGSSCSKKLNFGRK